MFGKNRLNDVQTPEQQYLTSPARKAAMRAASDRRTADEQRTKLLRVRSEASTAQAQRLSRVHTVGTLTRNDRGDWVADGWRVHGSGPTRMLPNQRRVHDIDAPVIEGLTLHDLCYAAHGPHCGCTRH